MTCPNHPEYRNDKGCYVKFKKMTRRFGGDYSAAARFLNGLRFKWDEGTFDPRDYAADHPLGFDNLIGKWLEVKRDEITDYRHYLHYAQVASGHFGNQSIKSIDFAELEDFSKQISGTLKTRKNYVAALHHFFVWCYRRKYIDRIPQFPVIKFVLGYRMVVGKETQARIIEEVRRTAPIKAYLAIKWLATYINVRPSEMRSLQEGNIDLEGGHLLFPYPKEKRYKAVPLIAEDIEILKGFPIAISADMLFFRKDNGEKFGNQYLWIIWKRACSNLGIEGLDLYGGTRHSSARALREHFSPERIRRALGSSTNAAFERYYKIEEDEVREVYSQASGENLVRTKKRGSKIGKVANL
jgi:integrase